MEQNMPQTPVEMQVASGLQSPGKTLKKVALLNIMTLGLYSFRWFYLNWKDFRGKAWPQNFSPLGRTFGIMIPILGLFLVYQQFKTLQAFIAEQGIKQKVTPDLLALCWYLLFFGSKFLTPLGVLPAFVLLLLCTWVLVSFQRLLNAYWQQALPERPLQNRLSMGETVFAIFGGFIWTIKLLVSLLS